MSWAFVEVHAHAPPGSPKPVVKLARGLVGPHGVPTRGLTSDAQTSYLTG
jgi:hypothetical protein